MNIKALIKNKKILIEIIVAGLLFIAGLIWFLVYRLGRRYVVDSYMGFNMMYGLFAVCINVACLYVVIVLLVNSKSEKSNRILEIFIAGLLFVLESVVALYYRISVETWHMDIVWDYVRLLEIFILINVLYIIALLIIQSKDFKLVKTVIAVIIPIVAFVTLWIYQTNMDANVAGKMTIMKILAVFAIIYILYAAGLKVFDFVWSRRKKNDKDTEAVTAPTSD